MARICIVQVQLYGVYPVKVRDLIILYNQSDLPALTPLSVAGWHRQQVGVAHCAKLVVLLQVLAN